MPADRQDPSPFQILIQRLARPLALAVILIPSAAWLADYAIWRLQLARGQAMSQVLVSRIVVAPLKGNKEEYYPDGTALVVCSNSLFPQAGADPCWWVSRHRNIQDR